MILANFTTVTIDSALMASIRPVSEFNSQDSLDVERSFPIVENENEENTAPPALPAASGIQAESPNQDELSEEYLDKQIPRNKKAMKIKLKNVLMKLHRLTNEKERVLEEKEKVIQAKDGAIEHFDKKVQLLKKQLAEQKEIVKEMQSTMESLSNKNTNHTRQSTLRADLDTSGVELESLRKENEQLKLLLQEKNNNLREREQEIDSLKQEKETMQQEKRESDKISLERNLSVDELNREPERGRAHLAQLEIRLTENEQALRQASDERAELRDQLRRKETLLLDKNKTLETLENSRRQWQDERRALSDEKGACEERIRVLEHEIESARQTTDVFRGDQPWVISKDEIKLSDKVLGKGAWGKVVEGNFRGTKVAVKEIHELILSPHNRRLFEREMSIASRCRHPHLLQFIGATNDDGSPLFVTELLDTDLRNILTQRALHQEEIVCLALDVSRGLNYLHLNKPFPIMHRDISSSNVLLWRRDNCWRAKLSDYGAANFMRQYMTENPGARIYAAPEAHTSQQSPKADVYSFGLLLCEMCIRELPVPQQIHEQIGLVTNGVFRELIMRCAARDPEARPTISDVISVLTQQAESLRAQGLVTINGRTATL